MQDPLTVELPAGLVEQALRERLRTRDSPRYNRLLCHLDGLAQSDAHAQNQARCGGRRRRPAAAAGLAPPFPVGPQDTVRALTYHVSVVDALKHEQLLGKARAAGGGAAAAPRASPHPRPRSCSRSACGSCPHWSWWSC